ncbi:glycine zipper 2TM domain-containing protein [Piscinibacter aquaticus]|uniref:Glycine zipper 2TM domain-containing protein n=1 Tax=Piscinibacter aquaticus TaxID=392597 RepID=A0A5C6TZQ7_9BURK|nr:glycine zipper 2TM domain-containing protein [Piscinibacter aquaticus]
MPVTEPGEAHAHATPSHADRRRARRDPRRRLRRAPVDAPRAADAVGLPRGIRPVQSIDLVRAESQTTGGGALLGGLIGAVVGRQIGSGSGRDAGTAVGAVGGAIIGNQIEKNNRGARDFYRVSIVTQQGQCAASTTSNWPICVSATGSASRAIRSTVTEIQSWLRSHHQGRERHDGYDTADYALGLEGLAQLRASIFIFRPCSSKARHGPRLFVFGVTPWSRFSCPTVRAGSFPARSRWPRWPRPSARVSPRRRSPAAWGRAMRPRWSIPATAWTPTRRWPS